MVVEGGDIGGADLGTALAIGKTVNQ